MHGGRVAIPLPTWEGARADARVTSGADALVDVLAALGVERAFGVMGGGIAPFCRALAASSIAYVHTRHECGAAFAALEASLASRRPTLVFTTTGPGLTNALTGMMAARCEGARVILVSAGTTAKQRGRGPCQETSAYTLPQTGLVSAGPLFHYATSLEHLDELDVVAQRLAAGVTRAAGFVAHVSVPLGVQTTRIDAPPRFAAPTVAPVRAELAAAAAALAEPFAIWLGFGARDAVREVRRLAEHAGAPVMCSPRAKGTFPEDHPLFAGVTGLGGHARVDAMMRELRPRRVLVLGSRLGEGTSLWSPALVPPEGFVQVDVDPSAFGAGYPAVPTLGVVGDCAAVAGELAARVPGRAAPVLPRSDEPALAGIPRAGAVRGRALMAAIQRVVVVGSDALVMAESGNSFMWTTHHLAFREPHRYRTSTSFGSMGHMTTGVVGAALARGGPAVAVVGDGAMLMLAEVSTAVRHRARAVWIVLNDACYGMVEQGIRSLGWDTWHNDIPRVDFVAWARALGADGTRVDGEAELDSALARALAAAGPFVVDVQMDAGELAPSVANRVKSLALDGRSS